MSTETLGHVEVDVDLSLEKPCECNGPSKKVCERPADFLYVFRCCEKRGFACQEHHLRNITGHYPYLLCKGCGKRGRKLDDLVKAVYRV